MTLDLSVTATWTFWRRPLGTISSSYGTKTSVGRLHPSRRPSRRNGFTSSSTNNRRSRAWSAPASLVRHLCVIGVVVLGYVTHASPHKDENLARIVLTVLLSQYEYCSDALFIGFQNFVNGHSSSPPPLTYLLPCAVFIVVYRRLVRVHLAHMYTSTLAKSIVCFDSRGCSQRPLSRSDCWRSPPSPSTPRPSLI